MEIATNLMVNLVAGIILLLAWPKVQLFWQEYKTVRDKESAAKRARREELAKRVTSPLTLLTLYVDVINQRLKRASQIAEVNKKTIAAGMMLAMGFTFLAVHNLFIACLCYAGGLGFWLALNLDAWKVAKMTTEIELYEDVLEHRKKDFLEGE